MKKLTLFAMIFGLLLLAIPIHLNAATLDLNPVAGDSTALAGAVLVNTLTIRLDEIALIEKAELRPAERKALRREVRSINKQLKAIKSGGIYISAGALILIIILIVVLL